MHFVRSAAMDRIGPVWGPRPKSSASGARCLMLQSGQGIPRDWPIRAEDAPFAVRGAFGGTSRGKINVCLDPSWLDRCHGGSGQRAGAVRPPTWTDGFRKGVKNG